MTSEHLRAQRSPAHPAEPDAVQPRPAGDGTRRVLAPQAPAALGGMGSTGPITLVQKKR